MEKSPPEHAELPDYEEGVVHAPQAGRDAPFLSPRMRKRLIRLGILILLLLTAPPLYRWIKNLRSEALLAKSSKSFALGDSQQGIVLLKQALALSPGNVVVQHAVELYNARAGDQPSLQKIIARMREGSSGKEELLGLADLEANAGHADVVRETLARMPGNISSKEGLRVALIEAAVAAREGSLSNAAEICLSGKWSSLDREERDLLRTKGALYLFSRQDSPDRDQAVMVLMEVVRGKTQASLPAWRILAQLALSPSSEAASLVSTAGITELIAIFPKLSGQGSQDRLLEADLKIKSEPASQPRIVEAMTKERSKSPRAEMLEFARWMNAKGLFAETIAFAGHDLPRNDTDWLLVVMDAQGAQGHWQEMAGMMDSPAGAGIPDAVKHVYLARTALMTGNRAVAEEEWRRVGGALHLEKPETLAYIAGYEEQIGEVARAARTYRELADRKETKVPGLIGLIRCQPRSASAASLIPLYQELLAVVPGNPDATCDLIYLKLLTKKDIADSTMVAEKLLIEQPDSLPRISTAALGRLRSGDSRGALEIYHDKVIDWKTAGDPWKVVRYAVLKANGEDDEAAALASSVNPALLRPEERDLLSKPSGGR